MTWLQSNTARSTAGRDETSSARLRERGVLLINLGTPDSPEVPDVRRYLAEFLSDPEVIQLPAGLGWLNRPLGQLIARFRAPKSAAMYEKIWTETGSPLYSITEEQATLLDESLPREWRVFYAMRYGRPSIAETLESIAEAGIEELVVVPMYPQYSGSTTRTALRELYGALERGDYHIDVTIRNAWFDDGGYIYAQAKLIGEYAGRHGLTPDNAHLVFSAHGLPVSYVERGDPYPEHVRRTVELVREQLGWPAERLSLAYQSRMGPAQWLTPATDTTLQELAGNGEKRIMVCPISFTADCLETLEEIDVRYRADVEEAGAELFLCPALNTNELFIAALAGLVVRGPRPMAARGSKVRPLIARPEPAEPDLGDLGSLIMVGTSLANRIGPGRGARLDHAGEADLRRIKKSQMDVPPILRDICAAGGVHEALVWNTCYRFEFYGWLENPDDEAQRDRVVRRVRESLLGDEDGEGPAVNVLTGAEAWHHLMRTVAGLNSGLPGDRDVVDQLKTAYRIAQRAGTAGPRMKRLVADTVAAEGELRGETEWGRFGPGYCLAAISRVVESTGIEPAGGRSVVIGGSTTSRSVLATLIQEFDVPSRSLTLVYRGQGGGRIKELRKAIGSGRRVRVQSYSERQAVREIAEADFVFFGIDREEPVLDADQIRDARDFVARPLTIIDFNTFGSTRGLETIPGVTLIKARELDEAVVAYADSMCAMEAFARALDAAEEWIEGRAKELRDAGMGARTGDCEPANIQAIGRTDRRRPGSGHAKQRSARERDEAGGFTARSVA